ADLDLVLRSLHHEHAAAVGEENGPQNRAASACFEECYECGSSPWHRGEAVKFVRRPGPAGRPLSAEAYSAAKEAALSDLRAGQVPVS
ncbi:MAG: hypothetical protein GY772_24600, partial [bacterium]|nr:hypothetical protein [bacterium]